MTSFSRYIHKTCLLYFKIFSWFWWCVWTYVWFTVSYSCICHYVGISVAELWYTFEPSKLHFWHVLIQQYLKPFMPFHTHFISYNLDIIFYQSLYLIHFWVYQSVFDTLLSASKCNWYTFECIKVYTLLSVSNCIWYTFECIKVWQLFY